MVNDILVVKKDDLTVVHVFCCKELLSLAERFMWGFTPHSTRGAASGLRQRVINPLETQYYTNHQ